jgi:hypothetical protein
MANDHTYGVGIDSRVKIALGLPGVDDGDVSAATPLPVSVVAGTVTLEVSGITIAAVQDDGPSWTPVLGVSGAAVVSADATGLVEVTDAPTAGQKLVITDLLISCDTAVRIDFTEEDTGTLLASGYFPAYCGLQQVTPRGTIKLPTADKKLLMTASAIGNVTCTALYHSEV